MEISVKLIAWACVLVVMFGFEGLFPHFKGRQNRIKHGFGNLIISIINRVVYGVLFAGLTLKVIDATQARSFGLVELVDIPVFVKGAAVFIIFDFWMYLWHRANHRILLLWRFHRMHHSDLQMDTTTALRFHPGEIIFSSLLRLGVFWLLGMNFIHLLIYEISLQPVILFHHSNVALPEKWDRFLRACIVTPNMHRVHHSQKWSETNSDYASIFSFWDRLFGTFRKRDDTLTIVFGLRILQEPKWQNLWGMLRTPFIRSGKTMA
ncbi:MAG: sterol desaturase family protein [Planctomycetota bacterium]|jgi:sterol desaturase/sphingolipid hydroxylase (fatty acid hydroxylase superfamily)